MCTDKFVSPAVICGQTSLLVQPLYVHRQVCVWQSTDSHFERPQFLILASPLVAPNNLSLIEE
jgi:hypothetical protein